ncbi:MAG: energy transducer TonB [Chitinophagaceae bacterium]|nr:energy transducer TonB [Chitinophagaceae bacterium]
MKCFLLLLLFMLQTLFVLAQFVNLGNGRLMKLDHRDTTIVTVSRMDQICSIVSDDTICFPYIPPKLILKEGQSMPNGKRQFFTFAAEVNFFPEVLLYYRQHIRQSKEIISSGLEGSVWALCDITEDGLVDHAEIVKSLSPIHDQEVLRMVCEMPAWNPLVCRGKKYAFRQLIRIRFWRKRLSE